MKKTKLYTVTGICVILAAITLVTTKNNKYNRRVRNKADRDSSGQADF